jgi:cytoskeletal protein CcmA (bactofilin family)
MKFLRNEPVADQAGAAPGKEEATMATKESGTINAFLGKGCSFDGKLTFQGTVRVDGRFNGEIFSGDVLEIGPDAEVKAEINVGTVIIAGRIQGNITAKLRADLKNTADVSGNIVAPVVTMEEGAIIDGSLKMGQRGGEKRATVQVADPGKPGKPGGGPVKPDPTVLPT